MSATAPDITHSPSGISALIPLKEVAQEYGYHSDRWGLQRMNSKTKWPLGLFQKRDYLLAWRLFTDPLVCHSIINNFTCYSHSNGWFNCYFFYELFIWKDDIKILAWLIWRDAVCLLQSLPIISKLHAFWFRIPHIPHFVGCVAV